MSDELLEVKPEFMGFQQKGYAGAFPPKVDERIRRLVASPSLHLFSGTSDIGDVRVDFERPEANCNMDVFEFIKKTERLWKFVICDPPYYTEDPERTISNYRSTKSFLGDVWRQQTMSSFLREQAENVLWFDYVSPCPPGFYREKTWLYLPGGWKKVRALTWLKRKGERLA